MSPVNLAPDMEQSLRNESRVCHEATEIKKVLAQIEEDCTGDNDLMELFNSMLESCARYTINVLEYKRVLNETGAVMELEDKRRLSHDVTIGSINAFARAMKYKGKNCDFIKNMHGDRNRYRKFAVLTTFSRLRVTGELRKD